jgi:hypothetical protein
MSGLKHVPWMVIAVTTLLLAVIALYAAWAFGSGTECNSTIDASSVMSEANCAPWRAKWTTPVQIAGAALGMIGLAALALRASLGRRRAPT